MHVQRDGEYWIEEEGGGVGLNLTMEKMGYTDFTDLQNNGQMNEKMN